MRDAEVPIIARVHDNAVCFDLRTVSDDDFEELAAGVVAAVVEDEDDTAPGCGPLHAPE